MARLYLVRHGEPAGTWIDSTDPGLTPLGREQAKAAAERLRVFGPLDIISSPLRRAQETAAPFAELRQVLPTLQPIVSEIPSPPGMDLGARGEWLRAIMARKWDELEPWLQVWRQEMIAYLAALPRDTAIFTHYVAINVAVAAARRDERVTVFAPAHASITILETTAVGLEEIEAGQTAITTTVR